MKNRQLCQSCSMPIEDPVLRGTQKDGSKSSEYCKYCYQDGAFVDPALTLDEMRSIVIRKMEENKIPEDIIEVAVSSLPHLKRWNQASLKR
ncbi:hypothetical protein D3H65_08760 [Paraflavitalea soli]|uniref:Putative zinc ribbon domain-containing protein n=1 Tax=Paraflavitalea soli TaxID=2315862 RepID=A0A3B7MZQ3_9BACT|nr:zinc ribbon domain-containing protein [Paraflavitalea soli]AXY78566.1 hypothetical protein D3H65_08760 [Paraflavitalea soli]